MTNIPIINCQKSSSLNNSNCIKDQHFAYNPNSIQIQMFQNGFIFKTIKPYSSEQTKAYRRKLALKIKEVLETDSQTDETNAKNFQTPEEPVNDNKYRWLKNTQTLSWALSFILCFLFSFHSHFTIVSIFCREKMKEGDTKLESRLKIKERVNKEWKLWELIICLR